jgi:aminodeoxyfutalosine deaminase
VRKISATWIFPGNQPPLKNGILICEDDGTVVDLIDTGGQLREQAGMEQYSGILVPGFVNAHCHLELSHLKGKIPEKAGLGGFLSAINKLRNHEVENQEEAMKQADFQMWNSGIVAVGDVSNSYVSLETKRTSKIYYHTFVEAFGFHPSRAEKAFAFAEFVESMFREFGLQASVTPHSPYSVSELLFQKIRKKALADNSILSVHNQESQDELHFS